MFFIRTAARKDLPAISHLLRETWHATYDSIYGVERVTQITESWHGEGSLAPRLNLPMSEFLVADDGRTIAGMAFVALPPAVKGERDLVFLHQLYVRPAFQRCGIGRDLLAEIETSFFDARRIRVEVEEANEPAISFYARAGFVRMRPSAVAGPQGVLGVPAAIFEKPLQVG